MNLIKILISLLIVLILVVSVIFYMLFSNGGSSKSKEELNKNPSTIQDRKNALKEVFK